jgi:hypothetical protein
MKRLQDRCNFSCSCPSCTLPDKESKQSDERRRILMEDMNHISSNITLPHDSVFLAWLSDASLPDDHFISHSENILSLMEKEGVRFLIPQCLYFYRLARSYIALGDAKRARFWAARSLSLSVHHPFGAELRDETIEILLRPVDSFKEWNRRNFKGLSSQPS